MQKVSKKKKNLSQHFTDKNGFNDSGKLIFDKKSIFKNVMSIDVLNSGECTSNGNYNQLLETDKSEYIKKYEIKRLNNSLEFISDVRSSSFSYENALKIPQERVQENQSHFRIVKTNRSFFNCKNKVEYFNNLDKKSEDNQDILKTIYKIKNTKQTAKKGSLNYHYKFSESFQK